MKEARRSSRSFPVRLAPLALLLLTELLPPAPVSAAAPQRLGSDVVPTFQEIRLELDADRAEYSGSVRIELRVDEAVSSFRFHAENLEIGEIDLRQDGERVGARLEKGEWGEVRLEADRTLQPGAATLAISFRNDFDTRANSLYRLDVGGEGYVFSQFEESDAREAFPCWDEPSFKFPYQVILRVPEGHTAVSNTPVLREEVADGWREVTFERTPPLPSYLLAIATGPLESVPIPGLSVPGRVVTVRGKTALTADAVRDTPPILAALETYFGRPYPYAKLDLIAAPEFWAGAMENPGAIVYADRYLLLDPDNASLRQRRTLAVFTAHELAHQWFGNLVTMAWWDDLWLNESFATWMGNKIADELYPQYQIGVSTAQDKQGPMRRDARPSADAMRKPLESTDELLGRVGFLYEKGQSVLQMFEAWLGPERFRQGVLAYLEAHQWGTATADDFWQALSAATGEDVKSLMGTYLDRPGVPFVSLEPSGGDRVRIRQERYAFAGTRFDEGTLWSVPLRLVVYDGVSVTRKEILLRDASLIVHLDTKPWSRPRWIFPDGDACGYFRWSVPPSMLLAMAEDATSVLSPSERVALVGNLDALLDAGQVHGDDYLRVLRHFAADPSPEVVGAVVSLLGGVKTAFVPEELEPAFAIYVRRALEPALERIGVEPTPGEEETTTLLRPHLIGLLADEGRDEALLDRAKVVASRYLDDPASVDPTSAGTMLSLAALHGDRDLFEEYRRRFETATDPRQRSLFLGALGDFRDPDLMKEALDYALQGPMRPQEVMAIPRSIVGGSVRGREIAFRWMRENFEAIRDRIPPLYVSGLARMAGGCSEERLETARTFFAGEGEDGRAALERLGRVEEQVRACRGLRAREGRAAADYLKELAGR